MPSRPARPRAASITALVVLLRDTRQLRWSEIVRRLHDDFGIVTTGMAVRARYRWATRGRKSDHGT